MKKKDIYYETLYNYMSLSEEECEENIKILAKDINYSNKMFTQDIVTKPSWHIAAQVLEARGYPMVSDIIPELFMWLRDWNWPGVQEILNILSTIPKDTLINELEKITLVAKEENDTVWLYWLREFMEENALEKDDFNNKDIFETLKQSIDM